MSHHPFAKRSLLRLKDIIAPKGPLPLSKSAFYAAIQDGRIAAPVKFGRTSAWPSDYIDRLIEQGIPAVGLATKAGDRS